ncbi:MAG: hypothetical protein ACK4YO_03175, partial [Candidatus Altarchaeaceae archaeon]
ISIDKGNLYIESPNKVKLNEEIKIYVKNEKGIGKKVKISITTPNETIYESTNSNGEFKFTPNVLGIYKIKVDDKNYRSDEKEIYVYGILKIIANDSVRYLDNFEIYVLNENGKEIDAKIKVLELNKECIGKCEIKAEKCGILNIEATKEFYEKAKKEISVKNRILKIYGKEKFEVNSKEKFYVKDEDNNSIKDVKIFVNGNFVNNTDENGEVIISIDKKGNYEINAVKDCYEGYILKVEVVEGFPWWIFLILLLLLLVLLLLLLLLLKRKKEDKEKKELEKSAAGVGVESVSSCISVAEKHIKKRGVPALWEEGDYEIYVIFTPNEDLNECKIIDYIPDAADETNIITLNTQRIGNVLILDLGNVKKGEKKILNYFLKTKKEIKPATIVWKGGKIETKIIKE